MPAPKFFKKYTSKNTLRANRDITTAPEVPANHEKDDSSKTLAIAAVVPTYPTEAQAVVHKEFPRPQGVGKFLNSLGVSTVGGPIYFLILKWPYRGCPE